MALNTKQQQAVDMFRMLMNDPNQTLMAVLGYAGTGKSYVSACMYAMLETENPLAGLTGTNFFKGGFVPPKREIDPDKIQLGPFDEKIWAAPSHKALNVSRRFLRENGVSFEWGYDSYFHRTGELITATTASALGIRPVIVDEQTADKQEFGKVARGCFQTLGGAVKVLFIDEISMLPRDHFEMLYQQAKKQGTKIVVFGDPGQLPPVNAKPIRFDKIKNRVELDQIMRQASDSAIPHLAEKIRLEEDWRTFTGPGVELVSNPAGAFLEMAEVPAKDERDRTVFVGYTNRVCNEVADACCRKLYGHGREEFDTGEIVISEGSFGKLGDGCHNQDQLRVIEFGEMGRYGPEVLLENQHGRRFAAEYLSGEDQRDRKGAFKQDSDRLITEAQATQLAWIEGGKKDHGLNMQRKDAWSRFYAHKDRTVLSFRHPFTSTSHKSQGSTYKNAVVHTADIIRFSPQFGMYVAVTRPSGTVFYGR